MFYTNTCSPVKLTYSRKDHQLPAGILRGDHGRWGSPSTATPADGSYDRKEPRMPVIVGVALGGAFGASGRYLLDRFIEQHTESVFPWSTFAINVTGCFLIGILIEQLVDRHDVPAWIRV